MTRKGNNRDVLLVLGGCAAIFILNLAWLLWVRHSNPEQLRYPLFLQVKVLLLKPPSLLALLAVLTSWTIAFVRSRRRENRTHSLVLLALILSTVFGLLLFVLFVS